MSLQKSSVGNVDQTNSDGDGMGDACECQGDFTEDGYVTPADLDVLVTVLVDAGKLAALNH